MTLNIDRVINCVKNIVDNHRCMICDKLEGSRWRYSCGHLGCSDCVEVSKSCILCLTPLHEESKKPVKDIAFSQRVEHAKKLLLTLQDALGIDVYQKHRQTEQQKIEKEVFPECIQAVSKYTNKRKSKILEKNIDKSSLVLPGERTSPVKPTRMEKSFNYLQQWLDNIEDDVPRKVTRKPLTTLCDNDNRKSSVKVNTPIKRRVDIIMEKFHESETVNKKKMMKNEKDESGIVMDDAIFIEDSQNETNKQDAFDIIDMTQSSQNHPVVNKDRLAWLAVLESERSENTRTPPLKLECSEIIQYTYDIDKSNNIYNQQESHKAGILKVPFFKKSSLVNSCIHHKNSSNITKDSSSPKDVKVTIESKNFTTTIQIMQVESNSNALKKQSVYVQTDINDIETSKENKVEILQIESVETPVRKYTANIATDSLDLFTVEPKVTNEQNLNNPANCCRADNIKFKPKPHENKSNSFLTHETSNAKELKHIPVKQQNSENETNRVPSKRSRTTVHNSDTSDDDGLDLSENLTVTAEVHRSSNENDYAVFSELIESDLVCRSVTHKRGRTPNSSDSSDKENRDPNRRKRIKLVKKDSFKKKNRKTLGIVN